ncbi:TetR/AcrR family transcriptional regulator [Niallia sp. 03133]|uniref:TetR/AcrR family transcriptional regulator n=1 Tax=Niallia sp. 03133 TaxID=3458060 RepID=UPI0040450CF7
MNNRKKYVLNKAHELFIEKGFHATSIQEILETSGISKGTFYNYFTSKNELLISIFENVYFEVGEKRKRLLIGQNKKDIDIFVKQIEVLIKTNDQLKIISLFEEILFTNDDELKKFLKLRRIEELKWLYNRLLDICSVDKEPYLLDCAIMLAGILHNHFFYSVLENEAAPDVQKIVQYSVNRIMNMTEELSKTKEQLLETNLLKKWLPDDGIMNLDQVMESSTQELKKSIRLDCTYKREQSKYDQLIEFIQEELMEAAVPRKHLVECALLTLKDSLKESKCLKAFNCFEKNVLLFISNKE